MNRVLLTVILLSTATVTLAQGRQGGAPPFAQAVQAAQAAPAAAATPIMAGPDRSGTAVIALIERLASEMEREFIFDPAVLRGLATSSRGDEADFESLRGILRASGFVVAEIAGQFHILREPNARSLPSRVLNEDDRRVSDHEVVTRVITLPESAEGETALSAQMLVPVLRPMMPQNAQLGAPANSNSLILVDYYDNVRRMTAVIESLTED